MKPSEVDFNGSFKIWTTSMPSKALTIKLASSTRGPESFMESKNYNFQLNNTFMWYKKDEPELLYRDNKGKLYRINFEPI